MFGFDLDVNLYDSFIWYIVVDLRYLNFYDGSRHHISEQGIARDTAIMITCAIIISRFCR